MSNVYPDTTRIVEEPVVTTPVERNAIVRTEPVTVRPNVVATYNYRAVRAVWLIGGVISALITVRFLLKLFGASAQSSFTQFMYGITDPLQAPFAGIFATSGQGSYVFEPASLVAIVVTVLLAWGIASLIKLVTATHNTRQAI